MKTSIKTPDWAISLVEQVCRDYKRKLPGKFQWYVSSHKSTSGRASYDGRRIHISAGTDDWEHRVVLLHELAHHVNAKGGKHGHTKRFWLLLCELSEKYGDINLTYKRDVELTRQWRPGTRVTALEAFDGRIGKD